MSDRPADNEDAPTLPPERPADADAETIVPDGVPPSVLAFPEIPGYEILGELGRGGMGVVYQARQVRADRVVALKMILSGAHASPQDLLRFRSEAEAVAKLNHPNVVQIFDVGTHDGLPYFTLEFCPNGSLEDTLGDGPMSPEEAAVLVERLARGMAYAHAQGLVHRDLKPANVLSSEDGTPKVTDFGLAKKVDSGDGPTATGAVLGTPSYMAPEQAGGQGKRVGPAADVWALGAILYRLLTGRPPFQAATPLDTILQVVSEEPPSVRSLNGRVPRDLETVCLKCLQKEPTKRYLGAEALAEDLRRFAEGRPIAARPVGRPERAWRWCKRNPTVAALLGLVLLSMTAGTGVSIWQAVRANRHAEDAFAQKQRADEKADAEALAKRGLQAALDQIRDNLYFSQISLAQREWQANNIAEMIRLLDECPPAKRGWEWHYLHRLPFTDFLTLRGPRARTGSGAAATRIPSLGDVAVSPDGRYVAASFRLWGQGSVPRDPNLWQEASAQSGVDVRVWEVETGREVTVFRGHRGNDISSLSYSPDGSLIASAGSDGLHVWEALTGVERRWFLPLRPFGSGTAAFSPDGRRLAFAEPGPDQSRAGLVRVWEWPGGDLLRTYNGAGHGLAFSPDGDRIASANINRNQAGEATDSEVLVWGSRDGGEPRKLTGNWSYVRQIAFAPEGDRLAAVVGDSDIRTTLKWWDVRTGEPTPSIIRKRFVSGISFDAAGGRLFTVGDPNRVVDVWDSTTGEHSATIRGHQEDPITLALSRDGRRIVSAATAFDHPWEIKVWDADRPQDYRKVEAPSGQLLNIAVDPVGDTLAVVPLGVTPAVVNLTDLGSGGERELRGHSGLILALAFSPDGETLATGGVGKEPDGTGEVCLWGVRSGELIRRFEKSTGWVTGVAFSHDGRRLIAAWVDETSESGMLRCWDLGGGREAWSVRVGGGVWGLAVSPDGRQLAASGFDGTTQLGTVWLRDMEDGSPLREIRPTNQKGVCADVAFRPDGSQLAVLVGLAGGIRERSPGFLSVRNLDDDDREVVRREVPVMNGSSVEYSATGSRFVAGDSVGSVRILTPDGERELLHLPLDGAGIKAAFGARGNILTLAGEDGKTVWVWDASVVDPSRVIRRRAFDLAEPLFAAGGVLPDMIEALNNKEDIDQPIRDRAESMIREWFEIRNR